MIVNVNIAMVSHPPVVLDNVSIIVPAEVIVLPFHKNGKLFAQTAADCVDVKNGVTVNDKVAIVSQPPVVLVKVSI